MQKLRILVKPLPAFLIVLSSFVGTCSASAMRKEKESETPKSTSVDHLTLLPQELLLYALCTGNLDPQDFLNFLYTCKSVGSLMPKSLLMGLQRRRPLRVTPTLLKKLIPHADLVKKVNLVSTVGELIDDNILEDLKHFPELESLQFTGGNMFTSEEDPLEKIKELGIPTAKAFVALLEQDKSNQDKYISEANAVAEKQKKNQLCLCNITNAVVSALPNSLNTLVLRGCPLITDKDFKTIAQNLLGITRLEIIECNGITNQSLQYIADIKGLTELSLNDCHNLLPAGLKSLYNHPTLRKLNLEKFNSEDKFGFYPLLPVSGQQPAAEEVEMLKDIVNKLKDTIPDLEVILPPQKEAKPDNSSCCLS